MRKTLSRKKHTARAFLSVHELSRAGSSLNLQFYSEGKKIGELEIGRGSLFWFGRNRQRRKRIRWSEFADRMNDLAYGKRPSGR
jgi:hypothetical protein